MAKIDEYLNNILLAKYGRDVRGSIHDAIELINAIAGIKFGTDVTSASSPKGDFEEGTFYINTDTNDLWHLTASAWEFVGNIKGAKGDKGDQGNQGIQGIQGVQGDKGDKGDKGDNAPTITNVVEKSHVGLVHTYTIELSDGNGYDFTVSDGQSGSGSGDMLKSVYDTNNDGVVDKAEKVGNANTTVLEGLAKDSDNDLTFGGTKVGLKITTETATLLASGWQGTSAPFTYDLNIPSGTDFEVLLPNTATASEVETVIKAQIAGNGTDNIIRAWGEKPTTNIDVVIRKVGR